jgi:hypothetical protein
LDQALSKFRTAPPIAGKATLLIAGGALARLTSFVKSESQIGHACRRGGKQGELEHDPKSCVAVSEKIMLKQGAGVRLLSVVSPANASAYPLQAAR